MFCENGQTPLRSTAFVIWHATAVPKSQMSVFPPNPRLAKLSIEPIEPIDDVDRRMVWNRVGRGLDTVFL
jgi:hypothetical protein